MTIFGYICLYLQIFGKMNLSHIEHIGIAVKSLETSIPFYEEILGLSCYSIEEIKDQKVRTAFFKIGETKLELLEATSSESPVAKFIEKRGEGIHHIAFAVDDINKSLQDVERKSVRLIDKTARKGAEGLDIGFLHPASTFGVLMEFCENKNKS